MFSEMLRKFGRYISLLMTAVMLFNCNMPLFAQALTGRTSPPESSAGDLSVINFNSPDFSFQGVPGGSEANASLQNKLSALVMSPQGVSSKDPAFAKISEFNDALNFILTDSAFGLAATTITIDGKTVVIPSTRDAFAEKYGPPPYPFPIPDHIKKMHNDAANKKDAINIYIDLVLYGAEKKLEANDVKGAHADLKDLLIVVLNSPYIKNAFPGNSLLAEVYSSVKEMGVNVADLEPQIKKTAFASMSLKNNNVKDFGEFASLKRNFADDFGQMGAGIDDVAQTAAAVLIMQTLGDKESIERMVQFSLENIKNQNGIFIAYQTALALAQKKEAEKFKDFILRVTLLLNENSAGDNFGNLFSADGWERGLSQITQITSENGRKFSFFYGRAAKKAFFPGEDGKTYNFYSLIPWAVTANFSEEESAKILKYFIEGYWQIPPLFIESAYLYSDIAKKHQVQKPLFGDADKKLAEQAAANLPFLKNQTQPARPAIYNASITVIEDNYKISDNKVNMLKRFFYWAFRDLDVQKDWEIKNKAAIAYQTLSGKNSFTKIYNTSPMAFATKHTDDLPSPYIMGTADANAKTYYAIAGFTRDYLKAVNIVWAVFCIRGLVKGGVSIIKSFSQASKMALSGKGVFGAITYGFSGRGAAQILKNWKQIRQANWSAKQIGNFEQMHRAMSARYSRASKAGAGAAAPKTAPNPSVAANQAAAQKTGGNIITRAADKINRSARELKALQYLADKNNMSFTEYLKANTNYRSAIDAGRSMRMVEGAPAGEYFSGGHYIRAKHGADISRVALDVKYARNLGINYLAQGGKIPSYISEAEYPAYASYLADAHKQASLARSAAQANPSKLLGGNVEKALLKVNDFNKMQDAPYTLPRSMLYNAENAGFLNAVQNSSLTQEYRFFDRFYKLATSQGYKFVHRETGGVLVSPNITFHPFGYAAKSRQLLLEKPPFTLLGETSANPFSGRAAASTPKITDLPFNISKTPLANIRAGLTVAKNPAALPSAKQTLALPRMRFGPLNKTAEAGFSYIESSLTQAYPRNSEVAAFLNNLKAVSIKVQNAEKGVTVGDMYLTSEDFQNSAILYNNEEFTRWALSNKDFTSAVKFWYHPDINFRKEIHGSGIENIITRNAETLPFKDYGNFEISSYTPGWDTPKIISTPEFTYRAMKLTPEVLTKIKNTLKLPTGQYGSLFVGSVGNAKSYLFFNKPVNVIHMNGRGMIVPMNLSTVKFEETPHIYAMLKIPTEGNSFRFLTDHDDIIMSDYTINKNWEIALYNPYSQSWRKHNFIDFINNPDKAEVLNPKITLLPVRTENGYAARYNHIAKAFSTSPAPKADVETYFASLMKTAEKAEALQSNGYSIKDLYFTNEEFSNLIVLNDYKGFAETRSLETSIAMITSWHKLLRKEQNNRGILNLALRKIERPAISEVSINGEKRERNYYRGIKITPKDAHYIQQTRRLPLGYYKELFIGHSSKAFSYALFNKPVDFDYLKNDPLKEIPKEVLDFENSANIRIVIEIPPTKDIKVEYLKDHSDFVLKNYAITDAWKAYLVNPLTNKWETHNFNSLINEAAKAYVPEQNTLPALRPQSLPSVGGKNNSAGFYLEKGQGESSAANEFIKRLGVNVLKPFGLSTRKSLEYMYGLGLKPKYYSAPEFTGEVYTFESLDNIAPAPESAAPDFPAFPTAKRRYLYRGMALNEQSLTNVLTGGIKLKDVEVTTPLVQTAGNYKSMASLRFIFSTPFPKSASKWALLRVDEAKPIATVTHIKKTNIHGIVLGASHYTASTDIPAKDILTIDALLPIEGKYRWGALSRENGKFIFKPYKEKAPLDKTTPPSQEQPAPQDALGPDGDAQKEPIALNLTGDANQTGSVVNKTTADAPHKNAEPKKPTTAYNEFFKRLGVSVMKPFGFNTKQSLTYLYKIGLKPGYFPMPQHTGEVYVFENAQSIPSSINAPAARHPLHSYTKRYLYRGMALDPASINSVLTSGIKLKDINVIEPALPSMYGGGPSAPQIKLIFSTPLPHDAADWAFLRTTPDKPIATLTYLKRNNIHSRVSGTNNFAASKDIPAEDILGIDALLPIEGRYRWGSLYQEDGKFIFKPYKERAAAGNKPGPAAEQPAQNAAQDLQNTSGEPLTLNPDNIKLTPGDSRGGKQEAFAADKNPAQPAKAGAPQKPTGAANEFLKRLGVNILKPFGFSTKQSLNHMYKLGLKPKYFPMPRFTEEVYVFDNAQSLPVSESSPQTPFPLFAQNKRYLYRGMALDPASIDNILINGMKVNDVRAINPLLQSQFRNANTDNLKLIFTTPFSKKAPSWAILRVREGKPIPVVVHLKRTDIHHKFRVGIEGHFMSSADIPAEDILGIDALLNINGQYRWGSLSKEDGKFIFRPYQENVKTTAPSKNGLSSADTDGK